MLVLLAAACADDPDEPEAVFGAEPLVKQDSDEGLLHLRVRSAPQPPIEGVQSFRFDVSDADGAPVEGLEVEVVPFMPVMGHGTSVVPEEWEEGPGVYRVDRVDLFMPGTWELRTTFSGPVEDAAVVAIDVP